MNRLVEELKKTGVFYVATVDSNNQPHVRPFSSVTEFEGKAYLCTNNTKEIFKQILSNPKIEISGMGKDGTWLRVQAVLVRDGRDEAKQAMLDDPTGPSQLYKLGDGIFEVFYLDNVKALKYSFTKEPETIV